MSFWQGVSAEAPADVEFSQGPRPDFSKAFSAAYDDVTRNWAWFGEQFAFENVEQEQLDLIYERTGKRIPPVMLMPYFNAMAKNFSGDELSAWENEAVASLVPRMAEIAKLKKDIPELLTYDEMYNEVKRRGRSAEQEAGKQASLSGTAGTLGGLAGGMIGSFTYRDPLNLLSLAWGGVGKTAAGRIASEVAVGAGTEAVDQFTGVQATRERFGLEHGTGQALTHIATVGIGAGVLRGLFEGGAAGVRWLGRRAEAQDVIGQSPFGSSRAAQGVHHAELTDAARHLDTPLFDVAAARGFVQSLTSVERLASRESDVMFVGASADERPISSIIGRPPSERSTISTIGDQRIGKIHADIERLTQRIDENDSKERSVRAVVDALASPDASRVIRAKLAFIEKQLNADPPENALARRRLRREREELFKEGTAVAKAGDARATASRRLAQVKQKGDDMRLQRAQKAASLDRSQPLPTPSGRVDGIDLSQPGQPPRIPTDAPPRQIAEAIDTAQKVLDDRAAAQVLPRVAEDGTVDIGLDKPVSGALEIVDVDTGQVRSMADAIEELHEDASLVRQMKACLI